MKTNQRKLAARFAPETRFPVTPQPVAPFRAVLETEFEKLQTRLLKELLAQAHDADLTLHLRHAAHEAAALAAASGFPLLVLPVLIEEKAAAARRYVERQTRVREATAGIAGVAA